MATFHIQQDPREKENVVISKNPSKHHQPLLQKNHHNRQDQHKEKRPTLAVLSNVEHVARGHQGKLMVQNKKSTNVTGGYIEKHAFTSSNHNQQQQQQQKKILQVAATAKVTTEQTTKSFVVYEDIQQNLSTVAVQSNNNNAAKAVTTTNTNVIAAKTVSISNDKPSTLLADHVVSAKASSNSNIDILPHAIRDPLKEVKTNDGITETPMSVSDILSPMSVDKSILLQNADLENVAPVEQKSRKYSERLFDVCEYQEDILEYYREIEKNHRPKPGYMKRQPDINNSMRTILIDWLVEVAEEYRLHTETLYLSVSYIDRFLSFMSVVRAKLQLVGTAAMFIAAKYEEIYPPDVGEFVFITDDTYSKAQVLKMEQIILKILKFDLNAPSAPVFLDIFSVMHNIPDQVKFLAKYLSELTLLEDEPFLHYLPSQISSASLSLARYILNLPIWCEELEKITKYSLDDLKEIILNLCRIHMESSKKTQQAIPEKYKSHKYMGVSTIKSVELEEEQLDYLIKEYNNSKTKKIVEGSNNELV